MVRRTTLVYHSFYIEFVGFYTLGDKKNAVKIMKQQ